ncbi:MAG: 50S ribosomal protein L17 [candidate division WS1 bacterium]|jgi:large subunit ribosomal protein L17|nr:50S ribosomal protein L17 [candidate division WS1 bacterium]
MRHQKDHRKLGRPGDQRMAMLRSQVDALLRHSKIKTTVQKAKETQRIAEKIITTAKQGTLHARRQVLRQVRDKDLVAHLFEDIAPRYADRDGGYTRVIRAGRRSGDNAEMAILELAD